MRPDISSIGASLLATVALLLTASVRYGEAVWALAPAALLPLLVLVAAFLLSTSVLAAREALGRRIEVWQALLVTLASFSLVFLALLLTEAAVSRYVLLGVFIAACLINLWIFCLPGRRRALVAGMAAWLTAALVLNIWSTGSSRGVTLDIGRGGGEREVVDEVISSTLYSIALSHYRNFVPSSPVEGGGIARLPNGYMLATGEGRMYRFALQEGGLELEPLSLRVPWNYEDFAADAPDEARTSWFRVMDVLAQQTSDEQVAVYVSHHVWKDEGCFVVQVSSVTLEIEDLSMGGGSNGWETVFESTPCLPFKPKGLPFAGLESGGRLALLDDASLLLTLGDHEFDGWNSERMLSQEAASSYGKTVLIDLNTGQNEIFSRGHRNPQGLYVEPSGGIWVAEHGPRGGDELNRIRRGANYGWPVTTYGANYGSHSWPLSARAGTHRGYEAPVYAWLPSIAPSSLVGIEGEMFDLWKGDLLVGSLIGNRPNQSAFWRLRVSDERVVYSEPLYFSAQVRDLAEGHNGEIIAWTNDASILVLRPAPLEGNGELLFVTACGRCHQTREGAGHAIGPDLWGVVGRPIGAAPNYEYSNALEDMEGRWTEENLDRYLADPQAFAPGTTMATESMADPNNRAAVIDYLEMLQ